MSASPPSANLLPANPLPPNRPEPHNEAPADLLGRDEVLDELRDPKVLTVLQGDAGVGRSALLAELDDRFTAQGFQVLRLRAGEHDRPTAFGALYRLLSYLDEAGAEPVPVGPRSSVLGLVAKLSATPGASAAPAAAGQLAMAVFSGIRRHLPLAVLIDDAQWLDDATAAVLEPLVRRMSGQRCAVVLGVRPDPRRASLAPMLQRLHDADLARTVTLRPLNRRQSRQLIAETLRANPAAAVVDELHEVSRGRPAALLAGLAGYRAAGALHVVDRHAYLLPTGQRADGDDRHPLLAPVRDAGPQAWAVARAMSLLGPLGESAPALAAEAAGLPEDEVLDSLDSLVRQRVLVRAGDGWRFRVPMLRTAVRMCLGPYERRSLAALAVTALWDGTARADDPGYLPERLVDAGRLVDAQRSGDELLAHGARAMFDYLPNSVSWLQAATERACEGETRATALLAHAAACILQNRMTEAARSSRVLLDGYSADIPRPQLQQAVLAYLTALAGSGNGDELEHVARAHDPVPGGPAQQLVAKAFVLGWLGRWREGRELLDENREVWAGGDPVLEDHANIYRTGVGAMLGEPAELYRFVAEPGRWRSSDMPNQSFEVVRHEANMLLALGELRPAARLLERNSLRVSQLAYSDRFVVEFMRGDWSRAMDTARRSMAATVPRVRPVGWAMLHLGAAQVHIDGGKLSRARQLIESGRSGPLPYLFDFAEAQVLRALGEHEEADERLRGGLRTAGAHGFELGTEGMWAELAVRAHTDGDTATAEEHLARLEELAERLGSGRARLYLLAVRARVRGDEAAAEEAYRLARERAQPYEMTITYTRLARSGYRTAELLPEAYRLAGGLGALLLRSRLRRVMRDHNVPVPSRGTTTSENERLLAVLVTEGLTNRQLAAVFGATEKSVEGRLTRMFARIGYRSRVELAAAMLTGEYPE